MKIIDVVCSGGRTGFYFDDQRAIKGGAGHDGIFYVGAPVTEGFTSVRQAGESISVMLILEDGQIAMGDCAAVQYSGAGGRDPLFLAKDFIPVIDKYIKPQLVGKEANDFRGLCAMMEAIQVEGKRLHTAIRYGMSQAILEIEHRYCSTMYPCLAETVIDHLLRHERTHAIVHSDKSVFHIIDLGKAVLYRMETCGTAVCEHQRNCKRVFFAQLFP